MVLWIQWWKIVRKLRPAFARERTFLWFALCLVGLTVRPDLRGVTRRFSMTGCSIFFTARPLPWTPSPLFGVALY
jgi:hypothetical protein